MKPKHREQRANEILKLRSRGVSFNEIGKLFLISGGRARQIYEHQIRRWDWERQIGIKKQEEERKAIYNYTHAEEIANAKLLKQIKSEISEKLKQ